MQNFITMIYAYAICYAALQLLCNWHQEKKLDKEDKSFHNHIGDTL